MTQTESAVDSDTFHETSSKQQGRKDRDSNNSSEPKENHHTYRNVTAMEMAQQINGDVKRDDRAMTDFRNRYENVVAMGESQQINCNVRDPEVLKLFFKGKRERFDGEGDRGWVCLMIRNLRRTERIIPMQT